MSNRKRGTNFSFYVTSEELDVLEEIRWRERKSMSAIVRQAIDAYINAHKEGNDTFKLDKWHEDPEFKAVPTISSKSEIWFKYLQGCTEKELVNFMILTTRINQQCKAIRGLK